MRQPASDPGQSAARHASGDTAGARFRIPALVGQTVAKVERDLIIHTVEHCRGNRTHAALILGILGLFAWSYAQFMDAFPKAQVFKMTSPYRDEVQVPVNPETMEPLPAHE